MADCALPRRNDAEFSAQAVYQPLSISALSFAIPLTRPNLCRRRAAGRSADQRLSSNDVTPRSSLLPGSVTSWLGGALAGSPADDGAAPPPDALATFRGSWLSHLDAFSSAGESQEEGERLWTLGDADADALRSVPQEQRLPSDCTFREDMRMLASGDVKGAAAAKQKLEDRQRRARALREKGK